MRKSVLPLVALLVVGLAGCKAPVVFTTHTSMGLDVSGTAQFPNKVSFSYNRAEASIIPRKSNGEAHSVYGGMDADMSFFGGQMIKQTFATGKAAMIATGADTSGISPGKGSSNRDALVFCTASTFGLHLTSGEQQMSPSLLLGYRRAEAAVIPVPNPAQEVRSVYADILINSSTKAGKTQITTNFSTLRGVRIKQSFATGRAAEAIAQTDAAKARLSKAAGIEATRNTLVSLQQQVIETVRKIHGKIEGLKDNRLLAAVDALKDAKVFSAGDLSKAKDMPAAELRRKIDEGLRRFAVEQYASRTTLERLQNAFARLQKIQN